MIATIEGDFRGSKTFKGKDGKSYFLHNIEMRTREGAPYNVEVFSTTNSHKLGPCKLKVAIGFKKGKDGKRIPSFRFSEVV